MKNLVDFMVEIEDCRHCGSCCYDCVFLDFSKEQKLYGCLIYNNKYRKPIWSYDILNVADKEPNLLLDLIQNRILGLLENESMGLKAEKMYGKLIDLTMPDPSKICYSYECDNLVNRGKVERDIRKLKNISDSEARKSVLRARDFIPDFQGLVEMLNESVDSAVFKVPESYLTELRVNSRIKVIKVMLGDADGRNR